MRYAFAGKIFFISLLNTIVLVSLLAVPLSAQQPPVRSPSDTVREFYKAMREKRFREAFALSIYRPAIDPLKPQEFEDLRPDFEKMAAILPLQVDLGGEQTCTHPADLAELAPERGAALRLRQRIRTMERYPWRA